MPLTIGVPRETFAGEKRVATIPEVVEKLIKLGFGVTSRPVPGPPPISTTPRTKLPVPASRAAPRSSTPGPT